MAPTTSSDADKRDMYRERARGVRGLLCGLIPRSITDRGLEGIATHKYKGGAYTPLDNLMNDFWLAAAGLVPRWIAPNLITLTGTCCCFAAYAMMARETATLEGPISPSVNVACAVCIFLYQTLDAMDGKHARNTRNGTPLGQLFDHGCDALGTSFLSVTLGTATQLGPTWKSLLLMLAVQVPFFCAQWEEYHTHSLRTNIGLIGVTEAQFIAMGVHLLAAVKPPEFWSTPVTTVLPAATPAHLLMAAQVGTAITMLLSFLRGVSSHLTANSPASSLNSDRLRAFLALLPTAALVLAAFLGGRAVMATHPHLTMFSVGLTLSYLTCQIIVCGMGRDTYPAFQPIAFGLAAMYASFRIFWGGATDLATLDTADFAPAWVPRLDLDGVLQVALGIVCCAYGRYVLSCIHEICAVLQIHCLRINPVKED